MNVFFIKQQKDVHILEYLKKIKKIDDKIYVNRSFEKMNLKQKNKIIKKIILTLKNCKISNIILDKSLKELKSNNLIYSNNINIFNGEKLFKILIDEFIEKIIEKNSIEKEKIKISIAINYEDNWSKKLIKTLAIRYKYLNVVTNNIEKFSEIESELYENEGIIINCTNNKKKGLATSNIIINVDFPEELINKYRIYENAIIVNLDEKIKIHKKRFNGKILNDYKIKLKENSDIYKELTKTQYRNYELKDLAEWYIEGFPSEIENIIIY